MKVSVVIPYLNEYEALPRLVDSLNAYFSNKNKTQYEVVFVDDGSKDGSSTLLKSLNHENYTAKMLVLSKNYGSHAALRAGVQESNGDLILNLNSDLQDPIELIDLLYEKCQEGNDIVWARRKSTQTGFFEGLFSSFFAFLVQKLINSDYPKMGLDIVMFNTKIKRELSDNQELNSSFFLQIMNLGFKQDHIYFHRKERSIGKSKWTFGKKIKLMFDTFVSFSYAPVRLVSIVGILFSVIGFIWTIYLILRTLFVGDLESGWPALLSILLMGFGITNLSLGIIAEYLWRILDSSKKRKNYIIDEVYNLTDNSPEN